MNPVPHAAQSFRDVFRCALGRGCPAHLVMVAVALTAGSVRAANFTTSVTQGVGQNWNAAIWMPEGGGAATIPAAGNTYTVLNNGTTIFNLSANARVRNPTASGVQTFVGESLILTTNTELRLKVGPSMVNFPGGNGRAGLIVDGGVLNIADNGVFTITGIVEVASTLLLNAVNDHGGALQPSRGLNLQAQLRGSGTMIIFQSSTNTPHRIANHTNTFSGQWLVTSGWLLGAGTNSLGTNDITINPLAPLGLDPALSIHPGPALLEVAYDINSAGTLTLTNGGLMKLRRDCVFRAVVIEGVSLSAGTHFYSDLVFAFPNTFLPDGSGSITVQPYGDPPQLAPQIVMQPVSQSRYPGTTVRLTVAATGAPPLSYQWRVGTNGVYVDLADGGNVQGATSSALTITNLATANAGEYIVIVSNSSGTAASSVARITVVTPTGGTYESTIRAADPVAFYQFNDLNDPTTNGVAFDHVSGFDGIYGAGVQNGYYFVEPIAEGHGFPGFSGNVASAQFFNGTANSFVTAPAWNLHTNALTIAGWVRPNGPPGSRAALVFARVSGTIAGLYHSSAANPEGLYTLGYNWNDEPATHGWNSGLVVPPDQWSFVALVVTPTNATIYVINPGAALSATHVYPHVSLPFDVPTLIGSDSLNSTARSFNGNIDELAIFSRSLSRGQIFELYGAGSGVTNLPPSIGTHPASQSVYAGQTARFTVVADGNPPPTYQWQVATVGIFENLANGGRVSGATMATLVISNLTDADAGDYRVVVTNLFGEVTSSIATLTVLPVGPPQHITMSTIQPIGLNWDTAGYWSDGNPASVSAVSNPGSTYEILPGGRMRSPDLAVDSTFPGDVLTVSGDGVFANNPGIGNSIGEIRFKQAAPTGTVRFKKLVMNGGQLDATNPDKVILAGHIEVLTNTPIYNDTAADRGCQIDAWLTGTGTIEYHAYNQPAFMPGYTFNLNINNTSNTFSGKWNVVLGVLLGTGVNSLGTNDITVGVNGVLETTYDINNPHGSLFLDGKVYLHKNDTFRNVVIAGTPLAPGTYTFAQLSSAYPNHFPLSWTQQSGSSFFAGSGSITILGDNPPIRLSIERAGAQLRVSWPQGFLLESDQIAGPWTTNTAATSPYFFTPSAGTRFYRAVVP